MLLGKVIEGITTLSNDAPPSLEITGIAYDSRRAGSGGLFAAIPGFKVDGHAFIGDAAANGAVAALTGRRLEEAPLPQIVVPDVRLALALAAANFYGKPSESLKLTGVTGTNGKTTTSHMIQAILETDGRRSTLLGGVEYRVAGKALPAVRTTPESVEVQQMLAQAVAEGDRYAVLEVSSHGIGLYRAAALDFDVAVFTNLTRDHLDLHGDMESYYRTKRRLFTGTVDDRESGGRMPLAVVNTDDEYGRRLVLDLGEAGSSAITFGSHSDAHVSADNIVYSGWTTSFDLTIPGGSAAISIELPGSFNLANALAAAAASHALGLPLSAVADGLNGFRGAPGRFELVDTGADFRVVIDYAHNEDGLARAVETARRITPGRLIVVFGCPGDRDRDKRPAMGRLAGEGADLAILTTDDCYSEPPEQILDEVEKGLAATGGRYLRLADRRAAIEAAVEAAGAGDTVLIAGKGHEDRQMMADGPVPFNDRETVLSVVAASH